MEMNFCRRCGSKLTNVQDHVFKCDNGHVIFANASPAVGGLLVNSKNEVLMIKRAIDPGKGWLDAPGGFCDGEEELEVATRRELKEELGLEVDQYGPLQYVSNGLDPYKYGGETLPVLATFFWARLNKDDTEIVTADDATDAHFVPIAEVEVDKIYFPSIKPAILRLRQILEQEII